MHASLIEKSQVEFKQYEIDNAVVEVVTTINDEIVNKSKYKRHVPNILYK